MKAQKPASLTSYSISSPSSNTFDFNRHALFRYTIWGQAHERTYFLSYGECKLIKKQVSQCLTQPHLYPRPCLRRVLRPQREQVIQHSAVAYGFRIPGPGAFNQFWLEEPIKAILFHLIGPFNQRNWLVQDFKTFIFQRMPNHWNFSKF